MRRVFWMLVGVGIGAAVGVGVLRAANRTKQRLSPNNLAREAAGKGEALVDRLRDALAAGKEEMHHREAELRAELKLDQ